VQYEKKIWVTLLMHDVVQLTNKMHEKERKKPFYFDGQRERTHH
jgi:hypothetical protein